MSFSILVLLGFIFFEGFRTSSATLGSILQARLLTPRTALIFIVSSLSVGAWVCLYSESGILSGARLAENWRKIAGPEPLHSAALVTAVLSVGIWNLILWRKGVPKATVAPLLGAVFGLLWLSKRESGWVWAWAFMVFTLWVLPIVTFYMSRLATQIFNVLLARTTYAVGQKLSVAFLLVTLALFWTSQSALFFSILKGLSCFEAGFGLSALSPVIPGVVFGTGGWLGGLRALDTLNMRMVRVKPYPEFVAVAVSDICNLVLALGLGATLSPTHTLTGALLGSASASRPAFKAVRLKTLFPDLLLWTLGPVVCAALTVLFMNASSAGDP